MGKRALLIGCNYPGTDAELAGCVNDVVRMRKSLIERFGFDEENIVVMIDTDEDYPQPTGANIRKALQKIVANTEEGDVLFMHYSGHGTRIPPESGIEDDTGYDECIVPTDMNVLSDDDFREVVNDLPDGVTFTFISDSCHSGGLIDHEKEQIGDSVIDDDDDDNTTNNREAPASRTRDFQLPDRRREDEEEEGGGYGRREQHGRREEYGGREEHGRREEYGRREDYEREEHGRRSEGRYEGSRHDDRDEEDRHGNRRHGEERRHEEYEGERRSGYGRSEESHDDGNSRYGKKKIQSKNRGLPVSMIMSLLSSKTGKDVGGDGVRTALYSVFGEDASPMVQTFVGILISQAPSILAAMSGGEGEGKSSGGGIGGMISGLLGGGGKSSSPLTGMLSGVAMNFVKSQMTSARELGTDDILSVQTSRVKEVAESGNRDWAFAGWKPEARFRVREDMGILVSGCQTDETSADANPGSGGEPYGALSNSIQQVLAQHEGPITCKELVMRARRILKKSGFEQNPGLYCSDSNSQNYFICP